MKPPSFNDIAEFLHKDLSLRRGPRLDTGVKNAVDSADEKQMIAELGKAAADFVKIVVPNPISRLKSAPAMESLMDLAMFTGRVIALRRSARFDRIDRLFCIFNTLTWALVVMQVGQLLGTTGWF